ncbi:MGMT family protein [Ilumatobacter sp.]|uniref:MGMT family protein n=1 Tax=Ilumatobacter sp. TaxID=1967498 RepID=UPI003C37D27E
MTDERVDRARRIIDVLMSLGEGEVTTYGDVAAVAGYPKQSRLVGRILGTTDVEVPWWRVVNAAGVIRASDPALQAQLLAEENVVVRDGRVVRAPIGRFASDDG